MKIKMNIKGLAAFFTLCLMAAVITMPTAAMAATVDEIYSSVSADLQTRDNARYCFDMANILSDSTENDIVTKGRELDNAGKGQIQLVTVDNLSGADQAQFATTLFNKEGLGGKKPDNGLLILMIKEGTHCQIVTGDGIAGTLTDGRCGRILDNYTIPSMKDGDYDKAAVDTYDACHTYLSGGEVEAVEKESGDTAYKIIFAIIALWILIWPLSLLLLILDRLFALCAYPIRRTWAPTPLKKAASSLAHIGLIPLIAIASGNGRGGGYSGGSFGGGGGGFSSGGGGSSSGGGAGR